MTEVLSDIEIDIQRVTKEVKRFAEEAKAYSVKTQELQLQTKNLLDGMMRLNTEVIKLNIRMGDVESKVGLVAKAAPQELNGIVAALKTSRHSIRESYRDLKIVLPKTSANTVPRKGT